MRQKISQNYEHLLIKKTQSVGVFITQWSRVATVFFI